MRREFRRRDDTVRAMFERADEELYAAGQAGRDHEVPWCKARAGRAWWRLSVPQTAPVLDLPTTPLVEWQGAQRWVLVDAGDAATAEHLRRTAAAVGGSASLFIAACAGPSCARSHFYP